MLQNIPPVAFDVRRQNFRRIIRKQEFSFDIYQHIQQTNVIFRRITTVMSLIYFFSGIYNIGRIHIKKTVFGISRSNHIQSVPAFNVHIVESFDEFIGQVFLFAVECFHILIGFSTEFITPAHRSAERKITQHSKRPSPCQCSKMFGMGINMMRHLQLLSGIRSRIKHSFELFYF